MKIFLLLSVIGITKAQADGDDSVKPPVIIGHKNLRRQAKSSKRDVMVQVCHKLSAKSIKGCGWQDLKVDSKGLAGHLGHGDFEGTCASTLCNDQDLCTLDYFDTTNCCTHEPVVCAIGEVCNPATGCALQECPDDGEAIYD